MSQNFRKVKRKMIQDIKDCAQHSQQNWADIMLRAARRCKTDEDQKEFFKFVLNPADSWDVQEPTFMNLVPSEEVNINTVQSMFISETDDEKESHTKIVMHNDVTTVGGTTYITVKPVECKSS